ncbi:unnamed protein product [Adineta steineri]|uniref:ADP ribosyltransferase domain-containing protein n=1 Tax=Adineta steineri TaxID=433720 RepID=A0A818UQ23_9BILA|nr:unnamed protein product [Adineta steineri]CAF3696041.1 unnamed protein product [Adineta steineri]
MANNKSITSIQANTQATAKHVSSFSKDAVENQRIIMQRMQNILLIWLDNNINENDADCSNTIKQLKCVVNNVYTFTDGEECVEFIKTIINKKVCMIVSGSLAKHIVPHVHDMSQVNTIFIFCNNQEWNKQWAKEWPKIKEAFTDITSICEALKPTAHQCEQNAISISFVAPNKKLDQLDPSFMYTQILKEILLTINFDDKHFKEFITYCREVFVKNEYELQNIEKLERDYHHHTPIWWYTYQYFLYSMLNQALRSMDADIMVRMGFFIKDLHRDIQRLHSEQFSGEQSDKTFTVYRGQYLSKEDFTEMTNTEGGLLSFNNFLSTRKDRDVSLLFAPQAARNPDLVGILFVMSINPIHSTAPFACVTDVSHFHMEDEVLFSMHTIFRIADIQPMDGNNHLYQVDLTLTNDNDQDLRTLTDQIRQETCPDEEGWYRLGLLLINIGQFIKAQEIYEVLLHQATNENDKAKLYHQLGRIKRNQGEYQEALSYYEKARAIRQQSLNSNHPDLAMSYNSIGDYPKALISLEKALAIQQQSLPSNHPHLGMSYNNIGNLYHNMGDYPKALRSLEKALAIQQQSLPSNHPDLGVSYNNIGLVYKNMGDYPRALSYYEKDLAIGQQSLASNHPDLAVSYNDIGLVYYSMRDFPKALLSHEKALAIRQQSLPSSHPDLSHSYNNIGLVNENMGNYVEAHLCYERAVQIEQQSLPTNHSNLKIYRENLENIKNKL